MAERLAYLEAIVGADITQFRKSMRDIRNETGILSESISGIGGAARGMTFAFTVPMVALGTAALDAASKFDGAMRNINSLLLSGDEGFASLSDEVLAFASTTRDGVIPATEALYEIFSAGITDQALAMEIWKTSTKVAEAGLSDLSATTNAITATMSAFNLEQTEATRVGNVWSRMVQVGVGSLDDFLGNAQKILPLSSALGVSLEDMGASVAFLSQGGGGARKAETAFAMMLSNLLKPTESMKEAFDELGVATGTQLLEKFGSVGDAIKALRDSTGELEFNSMFSKTGLEAAFRMTQNFDQLKDSVTAFNDGLDTATMDAWEEQAKSFDFQLDLMKSALGGVAVEIGQAIMPLVTPLINGFTDILRTVSTMNPELFELGVIFVGVVAGAAPLVWILTALLNPIGLVLGAVTALAAAFATNFGGIRDTVTSFVNTLLGEEGLGALKTGIEDFMSTLFPEDQSAKGIMPMLEISNPGDFITINPGAEAISLWSFFEGEGFIEEFSWDQFQQMARDAGWDGTAIEPGEILNLITPEGAGKTDIMDKWLRDMIPSKQDMVSAWADFDRANMGGGGESTIFSRLTAAIGVAWPSIQTALDNMWVNLQTWFTTTALPGLDTIASSVLTGLATAFLPLGTTGEGNSPVYDALKSLLSGDIGKAADQVGTWFGEHFPKIETAVGEFLTSVGAWIKNEGIPTISRSIGFLVGKIAVVFSSALSGLWGILTQTHDNGDVANSMAGMGALLGETTLTPMGEGYAEAIAGAGITNPIDELFTSLSGALVVAAGAWVIAPAFASTVIGTIGKAVLSGVASSTVLSGVGSFIMTRIIGSFAVAASVTNAGVIVGSAGTGLLGLLGKAGALLAGGISATTTWIASAAGSVVAALGSAIALAPIAAGIALGTLLYVVIPQEWKDAIHNVLGSIIDGATGGEGTGSSFDERISNWMYEVIGGAMVALGDERGLDVGLMSTAMQDKLAATGININMANVPVTATGQQGFADRLMTAALSMVAQPAQAPAGWTGGTNPFQTVFAGMGASMVNNIATDVAATDKTPIFDSLADVEAAGLNPKFTEMGTSIGENIIAAAVTKGETDGQLIVDSLVTPLATGFATAFGEGSPAVVAWAGFVTGVNEGVASTGLSLTTFNTNIDTARSGIEAAMPLILTAVQNTMNGISASAIAAESDVQNLANTLAALNGSVVTITTSVEGGAAPVDGSYAKGLNSVPYDGFVAELHKGERILTAGEANMVDHNAVVGRESSRSGDTYNQASFLVQGVTRFEDIIREAKRQGYKIDKR